MKWMSLLKDLCVLVAIVLGALTIKTILHENDELRTTGLTCVDNSKKALDLGRQAIDAASACIVREKQCLAQLGSEVSSKAGIICEVEALSQAAEPEVVKRIEKLCKP